MKEKPKKINKELASFIAHLFSLYFNTFRAREEIEDLKVFENEINNPQLFMDIFSIIIIEYFKHYNIYEFRDHINKYINEHYMEAGYESIYYKVLIIDSDDQENFLLNNLSPEYAIKLEDLFDYPNNIHPRLNLFRKLYNCRLLFYNSIINTEYYKQSVSTKDNITSISYKYAINISKNLQDFYNLFLFFIPKRLNEDEDYKMANILFDFNDMVDYCKNKYDSLKVILSYLKHFFKIKRKVEILSLEELIQILENTPVKDFSKYEIKIDSFLVDIKEAEMNDKLFNSFFFMGMYSAIESIFPPEEEEQKFQFCLMQFNELRNLGNSSGIDSLGKELEIQLVELVYKNKDRLDDELEFIKDYFNWEDNPNFDMNRIKRSFLNKVNNYQNDRNLGDYQIDFDKFNLIEEDKPNNNNEISSSNIISKTTKKEVTDTGGFSLFENDDNDNSDNDDFCLLGKDEIKTIENNKIEEQEQKAKVVINEEEIKNVLKDMNLKLNEYYYIYRVLKSFDDIDENVNFNEKYYNFFSEIFNNINKFDILTNKQFYEQVIIISLKIFLSGVSINYFNNENNKKNEMYLIYEFYEILDVYKRYNLLNKQKLFKIIEKLMEYKKNEDDEIINIIRSIENLFLEIGGNIQKKAISNLFVKILCLEKNKININEFNHKLINFSFRNDNNFLFNDIIPLIDEYFKEEIYNKINILDDNMDINNKNLSFQESLYEPIEKQLNNFKEPEIAKDLEDSILYYFESKIFYIFSKMKKDFERKRDFFQNEDMKNNLKKCLLLLEDEHFKRLNLNNKRLSLLFNIAFIKCFLSDYIYNLYNSNQEMGNVEDINDNIIKGNGNNPFRTSIKLYILKLFYNLIGNYPDFLNFNYGNYQIYYFQEEEIKFLSNFGEMNNINKNIYGFDSLFLPSEQNEFNDLINLEKNMINSFQDNIIENENLIHAINNINNLDIFLCSIINIFISNFKDNLYFNSNIYKNASSILLNNINNNKFIKIQNLIKDILLLFIDQNKYENKILKNENMSYEIQSFSYNQILAISLALRFVVNSILFNNQNSVLFQILLGNINILTNKNIFIQLYFQEFSSYNQRNINQLTFTIIRFIIISHIYFGFLLDKITLSNINHLFNNEENIVLIDVIEKEFNFMKKILDLKGIKNIIIFMNNIFNDIKSIIVSLFVDNCDENVIRDMETKIENEISKYLENFSYYVDEYDKKIEKMNININNNEFKKIITEEKKLYNDKNIEKKYPFIKYLTLTNFCGIEDFKNQFLFLITDKLSYPMINCLINNDVVITLIKNLPFINDFFNEINNELLLKIRNDDADKKIEDFLSENIKNKFNEYNEKINEINALENNKMNKISEINKNTKIIDIINIKNNSINKMFDNFIKIYNEFLTNTKIYKDNKNIIEPITIQEASKNDFIDFELNNNQNNENNLDNKISIFDRLNELLYLYSDRIRYHKNELNVNNNGKINYDFTQIENALEKEYLYGKRPFNLEQKNFIFLNEAFSNERNNIIEEFINKYTQEEITDEIIKSEFDKFINDENKSKNDLQKIYISLQYMIIFLVDCNINFREEENILNDANDSNDKKFNFNLDYIVKILRKRNYQINDLLSDFLNNYKENIGISNLLYLYEKSEIKYFQYICNEIAKVVDIKDNIDSITLYFNKNSNDLLLNEGILLDGIKKFIMRYCLGDNQDKIEVIKKVDLKNIFDKKCIWHFILSKKEQENKFKDEVNTLLNLDKEGNNLIKYLLKKLLASNIKLEEKSKNERKIRNAFNDDDEDDEELITKNRRKRKKKRMQY